MTKATEKIPEAISMTVLSTKILIIDIIEFESPYGIIGQLTNQLFLTSYLHQLLLHRNEVIKQYDESSKWKAILI